MGVDSECVVPSNRFDDAVTYDRTDKCDSCSTSTADLPMLFVSLLFFSIAVTPLIIFSLLRTLPLLLTMLLLTLTLILLLLLSLMMMLLLLLPKSRSDEMATRNDERAAAVRAMSGTVQREPRFFMSDV